MKLKIPYDNFNNLSFNRGRDFLKMVYDTSIEFYVNRLKAINFEKNERVSDVMKRLGYIK